MRKSKKQPRTALGKVWYFIWEDDSALSWIVNIILAIILIKFVVYPGLGLALGTQFPIVAVVSDSMEHNNYPQSKGLSFNEWWKNHAEFYDSKNISYSEFREFPFKNGFNKGDLMILKKAEPSKIEKGDIIVFSGWRSDPIIHRVVEIEKQDGYYIFGTKGDNNPRQIAPTAGCSICDETSIHQNQIYGKAVLRVPYLGWVKIIAFDAFMTIVNIFR